MSVHFFIRLLVNNFERSNLTSPPDKKFIQNWRVSSNPANPKKSIVISYSHENYSGEQQITLSFPPTDQMNLSGITALHIFASTGSYGVQDLLHSSKLPSLLHIIESLDVIFANHSTDLDRQNVSENGIIKIRNQEDLLIIGKSLIPEFGLSILQTARSYAKWQLKQQTFMYATPRFFFDNETETMVHNLSQNEQGATYYPIRNQYDARRALEESRESLAEDLALPRSIELN
jgi:hypothetical protein